SVVCSQAARAWWLAHEAEARALASRLAGAAAALRRATGDARCADRCERLSAAIAAVYAR
ncbi:hypothetical protein MNEG_10802, partial [Monoraphidium neglectum]